MSDEQYQDFLRRLVELEKVHTRYTGPRGPAATIRVGSVSTVPAGSQASVVNVGTPNAAILNFAIPQGKDSKELDTLREERAEFREEKNDFRKELYDFRIALLAELRELYERAAADLASVYQQEVGAFCQVRDKACAAIAEISKK